MQQTAISKTSLSLPQSSLISQDRIWQTISAFGNDYIEFIFSKYHHPMGIEKAVDAKAPTFHDVTTFFGEGSTKFWLRFHIAETFYFIGIYDTSSRFQIQHTADLIMQHPVFGQLTLTEFLCFLQRFKMGNYGKIYQSARPNPQEFLMCLTPFWNELSQVRGKRAEKERLDSISRSNSENMTREEWLEIKTITAMYNSEYTVR